MPDDPQTPKPRNADEPDSTEAADAAPEPEPESEATAGETSESPEASEAADATNEAPEAEVAGDDDLSRSSPPSESEATAAETSESPEATEEGAASEDDLESAPQGPTPPEDEEVAPSSGAGPEEPDEDAAVDPSHEPMLERLRTRLGDDIVAAASVHGHLVVRVTNEAWHRAAEVAKAHLDCEYLSYISGIDWMPRPAAPTEDPDSPSVPAQPKEMTFGVTGSAGRFQVFACVESTDDKIDVTFKTDLDEDDPRVASWTDLYPGAEWHERECWEMFGFVFDGHPHLRHLYLPGEFEGHPLRKDFPLLAREVKPWPGLVDVELMPEESASGEGDAGAGAEGEAAEATAGSDQGGEA